MEQQFALKITNRWNQKSYLYPQLFSDREEAEKHPIPQRTENNIVEVVKVETG